MSEPFLGQITIYPYNFAPYQWADCAGQILSISQYSALFSLLGTQFGGNGISNFALPDLQGRVGINQGTAVGGSPYTMGEAEGQETVTLAGESISRAQSQPERHLGARLGPVARRQPAGNRRSRLGTRR